MKIHETAFEEYVLAVKHSKRHPSCATGFPETNRIFYGPKGSGKYSQALYSIHTCSPSKLKYEKRMTLQTEKGDYTFRFSDIHYEIDMSLLGCNSKIIWDTFFQQVVEIVSVQSEKRGIIVCTNFHHIHAELLDTFSSYYKQFYRKNDLLFNRNDICLRYMILTEHLSFIPPLILNSSAVVSVPLSTSLDITKSPTSSAFIQPDSPTNKQPVDLFHRVCIPILDAVRNARNRTATLDLFRFRDLLYDINIYQMDVLECLWFVLFSLVESGEIQQECLSKHYAEIIPFLKYYNNNYRTIYHFESIFLHIILG